MKEKKDNKNILKKNNKSVKTSTIQKGGKIITPSNSLLVIVVVLVVMSGVQVFQTQRLLRAISNGEVKVGTQTQGSSIGLPSQVGGCG